jgi:hypothetical protein
MLYGGCFIAPVIVDGANALSTLRDLYHLRGIVPPINGTNDGG